MSDSLESLISKPIPPVDPEDIKRIWPIVWPLKGGDVLDFRVVVRTLSPGADANSVFARAVVVKDLVLAGQLNPEDLPDKVFHLAATVPLKPEAGKFPFDRDELLKAIL